MNADGARRSLITSSLVASGTVFVFFLIAPLLGFPLRWDQSMRIFEIVLPVFLAYLGTAVHFVFRHLGGVQNAGIQSRATDPYLNLLIRGPLAVFALASVALVTAFWISNRPNAPAGMGMSVDLLAAGFAAALGILTVTTNVAVSYLFTLDENAADLGLDSKANNLK